MRFIVVSTFFISNSALKFPILQWIYRIRQEMTNKTGDDEVMTEYIANMLTKNMYMDGLIKESEESIYSYSIQLIVEKIIGFSAIYMIALFQGYFFSKPSIVGKSNSKKSTKTQYARMISELKNNTGDTSEFN